MQKTVVVALSGGVDSSVAALLLKKQGYRVIGMFMKNWEEASDDCPAAKDAQDVASVCGMLDIPHYTVSFARAYREQVFAHFLHELKQGRTPNPDTLCNREIKFKALLDKALSLGADYLATGHYAQIDRDHLCKGADPHKDQSYFLYALSSRVLEKVLFPIGHLHKREVRALAREVGLCTAGKKDSTGICFIGERHFKSFVGQYLGYTPGDIESVDGKRMGRHVGIAYYTLGQRKGLGIGGPGEAWFVVGKDAARNVIVVAQGENHPALFRSHLEASELSWISSPPQVGRQYTARIRYRQPEQACVLADLEDDRAHIAFTTPQRAITPGQAVVLYDGNICLGGGVIAS